MAKKAKSAAKSNQTAPYKHPEAMSLLRPSDYSKLFAQTPLKAKHRKCLVMKPHAGQDLRSKWTFGQAARCEKSLKAT